MVIHCNCTSISVSRNVCSEGLMTVSDVQNQWSVAFNISTGCTQNNLSATYFCIFASCVKTTAIRFQLMQILLWGSHPIPSTEHVTHIS